AFSNAQPHDLSCDQWGLGEMFPQQKNRLWVPSNIACEVLNTNVKMQKLLIALNFVRAQKSIGMPQNNHATVSLSYLSKIMYDRYPELFIPLFFILTAIMLLTIKDYNAKAILYG
ncbi:MAG: hypothetical protein J1F18_13450, partial [Lachnospiraceae bacterium]|nr:hypothetical protein [Lachnospiraceae bacterium]